MEILNNIRINKSVAEVWKILGEDFVNVSSWASDIPHSAAVGRPMAGEVCEGRSCDIKGMGKTSEKITKYDPINYVVAYDVIEGFPFFVKRGSNHWRLEPQGNATLVHMDARLETKGLIGAVMAPMMKMQMRKMLGRIGEELKHYAETGQPHPRKVKALSSMRPVTA